MCLLILPWGYTIIEARSKFEGVRRLRYCSRYQHPCMAIVDQNTSQGIIYGISYLGPGSTLNIDQPENVSVS